MALQGSPTAGAALRTGRYGAVAQVFHWLTLTLVLLLIPIGLVMTSLDPGSLQDTLFTTHELLGLTILVLTFVRLAWRLIHSPPRPSRHLSHLEVMASGTVHYLLYGVLLLMPVTGYLFVVAGNFPLTYFGLDVVPRLVAQHKGLSKLAESAHLSLQYVIYALILMHAGAALHRHFWRHNDVLARMLPWTGHPQRGSSTDTRQKNGGCRTQSSALRE